MPKKNPGMTPEEQSRAFADTAQRMIDAGALSPTEAQAGLEKVLGSEAERVRAKAAASGLKVDES